MAENNAPSEQQLNGFVAKMQEFRKSLDASDQELLDSMYYAAMGEQNGKNEDVQSYWVAVGPRGGVVYGGWHARPWGTAWNNYYPRPTPYG